MKRNDEFMALYKDLEAVLEGICHPRAGDSPLWVYENTLKKSDILEKKLRAERYATIRQLRNILAHEDMNHGAPFIISDETIEFMTGEIDALKNQETAEDVCVPFSKLVYAIRKSYVKKVVDVMLERGISNVPILEDRRMVGMFNGKAFLHMMKSTSKIQITDTTKISDMMEYLHVDMHDGIRYEFVARDTKLDTLEELFRRNSRGKTELAIVTEKGNKYDPVIGVISPHDILERR